MSNFALVSTTDTMGDDFPCHEVFLFETEQEAIEYAVELILKHDQHVQPCGFGAYQFISDPDGQTFDAEELLEAWQSGLGITEYFHIMPVKEPVRD